MIVHLEPWECEALTKIARLRNDPKEERGIGRDKAFGPSKDDPLQYHIVGVYAEYATAQILGLDIDYTFSLHGDNHRADLWLDDYGIAVKYRNKKGWDYALISDQMEEFDVAVLCYPGPSENSIDVYGWADKKMFSRYAKIANYGYGDRLVLGPDKFRSISELAFATSRYKTRKGLRAWKDA